MGMLKLACKWKKIPKQDPQKWENSAENPSHWIRFFKNAVLPTQQPLSEVREPLSIGNIEAQVLHLKVFGMAVTMEENEELHTNAELNPTAMVLFNRDS